MLNTNPFGSQLETMDYEKMITPHKQFYLKMQK